MVKKKTSNNSSMMNRRGGRRRLRWTLVALGEESEGVNLFDEISHASPTTKAKTDDQNPDDYERVDNVHCGPTMGENGGRFLGGVVSGGGRSISEHMS